MLGADSKTIQRTTIEPPILTANSDPYFMNLNPPGIWRASRIGRFRVYRLEALYLWASRECAHVA